MECGWDEIAEETAVMVARANAVTAERARPREELEARICELAGHIAAATCHFLLLVAEYDRNEWWAEWDMPSCAAWLSWKCQISPGTGREHVRVARALERLPVTRERFAAGMLSYSKVRALTRIAEPGTEAGLAEMAMPMTASQLDRFAAAFRRCTGNALGEAGRGPEPGPVPDRKLTWDLDSGTGELRITAVLPPAEGALVLKALRAALGIPGTAPAPGDARPRRTATSPRDLAGALTEIAGQYLAGKLTSTDNPDLYQIIIHATPDMLPGTPDVPAGTPAGSELRAGHPAAPGRCHLEDGPALTPAELRRAGCGATWSAMLHHRDGSVLTVGRRGRTSTAAIRRAVRERDGYRCAFPGCGNKIAELHHIVWWSRGGHTSAANLILLCKTHHDLVHENGYLITRDHAAQAWVFTRPARPGRGEIRLTASNDLPAARTGDITTSHDAVITAETIIPPFSGEPMDLDLTIWAALNHPATRPASLSELAAAA